MIPPVAHTGCSPVAPWYTTDQPTAKDCSCSVLLFGVVKHYGQHSRRETFIPLLAHFAGQKTQTPSSHLKQRPNERAYITEIECGTTPPPPLGAVDICHVNRTIIRAVSSSTARHLTVRRTDGARRGGTCSARAQPFLFSKD